MLIGVFDSGIGGLSVANAIETALPDHRVLFMNDVEHMPYGFKTPDELYGLVVPVFQQLVDQGCEVIVVACNTVSTTIIERLRQKFDLPIIGVEPLVKLAAELTDSDVIAVCATPTTLASERYKTLKETYAAELTVLEPDCSNWARMIEHDKLDEAAIHELIEAVLGHGADVIVLGCTHYHWIEALISSIVQDKATIIQPEPLIIEELIQVLVRRD